MSRRHSMTLGSSWSAMRSISVRRSAASATGANNRNRGTARRGSRVASGTMGSCKTIIWIGTVLPDIAVQSIHRGPADSQRRTSSATNQISNKTRAAHRIDAQAETPAFLLFLVQLGEHAAYLSQCGPLDGPANVVFDDWHAEWLRVRGHHW